MSSLRGLTVVVAGADPARLHVALSLAAAQAALGGRARLFLQAEAAALLGSDPSEAESRYLAAGMPGLGELIEESLALGVSIIACQSGLALAGRTADALPTGVTTGGLVELLSSLGEDRLIMA